MNHDMWKDHIHEVREQSGWPVSRIFEMLYQQRI